MSPLALAVHDGIAAGVGFEDIAREQGVSPDTVREAWRTLRQYGRDKAALRLRREACARSLALPGREGRAA